VKQQREEYLSPDFMHQKHILQPTYGTPNITKRLTSAGTPEPLCPPYQAATE